MKKFAVCNINDRIYNNYSQNIAFYMLKAKYVTIKYEFLINNILIPQLNPVKEILCFSSSIPTSRIKSQVWM